MSKFTAKTAKSVTLFSVILVILVAVSIVVTALCGVNYADTMKDCNALTITVNSKAFEDKLEQIESKCEAEFDKAELSYNLVQYGEMSGDDCEIVYQFDKCVNLNDVKTALTETFNALTAADGEWNGSFITVSSAREVLLTQMPTAYAVRTAIAVAVFAVLAFVYVSLRYRLNMGVITAISAVFGAVAAAAIVLCDALALRFGTDWLKG